MSTDIKKNTLKTNDIILTYGIGFEGYVLQGTIFLDYIKLK